MVVLNEILEKIEKGTQNVASITVNKHLELDLDLGTLLGVDLNILDKNSLDNDYLRNLTRDNVQLLFNKLWELPTDRVEEAIVVELPSPLFKLPRIKPVPKPKALTKWQQFAKEKGIQKKKKAKLTWDDQLKKWVPRFGFKKAKAEMDKNWVLEVPANAPFEDQFEKKITVKAERVAKNELQRLRNIAKSKDIKIPRFGILNPEKSTSKDLQTAITVAKSSTASVGKFQQKLPNEKEARGIATITPGVSRKRKLPPVSGDEKNTNLNILDSILHKRPKLDIEQAVSRRHNLTEAQKDNPEKRIRKGKGPGKGKMSSKPSKSKKPASGKGQRKGKGGGGGGRKRR
ncbi:hypothetical protein WA026_010822 [Henosepilachna vigintioctopunctata]|uniref:Ribosome biogenesis regulatory protein n=1 Tax=Henosepilachna vigintioctopunctata TaxID=420089 RepID=A0AAW1US22_9CUCU